jgi:hypothetical protein
MNAKEIAKIVFDSNVKGTFDYQIAVARKSGKIETLSFSKLAAVKREMSVLLQSKPKSEIRPFNFAPIVAPAQPTLAASTFDSSVYDIKRTPTFKSATPIAKTTTSLSNEELEDIGGGFHSPTGFVKFEKKG